MTPSDHFPSLHHLRVILSPTNSTAGFIISLWITRVSTRAWPGTQQRWQQEPSVRYRMPLNHVFLVGMSQHMFMIFHYLQFHVVDMVRIYIIYVYIYILDVCAYDDKSRQSIYCIRCVIVIIYIYTPCVIIIVQFPDNLFIIVRDDYSILQIYTLCKISDSM